MDCSRKDLAWALTLLFFAAACGSLVFTAVCARYGPEVLSSLDVAEPEAIYRRGIQCEKAGDLDAAIDRYRKALAGGLSWRPMVTDCRRRLSILLIERGRIPDLFEISAADLLCNSGFDVADPLLDGWEIAEGVSVDPTESIDGGRCLCVNLCESFSPVVSQSIALLPSTRYRLSYWAKSRGIAGPAVCMQVEGADGRGNTIVGRDEPLRVSGDWAQHAFTFKTPSASQRARVGLFFCEHVEKLPTGSIWLDACRLARVKSPFWRTPSCGGGGEARQDWNGRIAASGRISADEQVVVEGRRSVRITLPGNADFGLWQCVDVVPGAAYRLIGWVKTQDLNGLGARVEVQDAEEGWKRFYAASDLVTGTHDWQRAELCFRVPETIAAILVYARRPSRDDLPAAMGTVWFDGFALEKVDKTQ